MISEKQWASIKESVPQLTKTTTNVPRLSTFADHTIKPLREVHQHREHDTHHHNLQALVVPRHGPNLVGHDWLSVLKLNWATIHHVDSVKGYADLLAWFPKAFGEDIGTLKDVKASIHGCETRCKTGILLIRKKVYDEFDRLLIANTIERVA